MVHPISMSVTNIIISVTIITLFIELIRNGYFVANIVT